MVDVVDGLHIGMRCDGYRIEAAHFAHHHEGRVERGQRLHVGAGAHVFVAVKDGDTILVLYRNDRVLEAAFFPGLRRTFLAFHRIGIHIVAREAVFGGNQIGRNALRHEVGGNGDGRIHRPGTARHAHADAAHAFNTAGNDDIIHAGADLRSGKVHGIEARGAKPVDLHAGNSIVIACFEHSSTRDVGTGFADRIDAAHDDIVHRRGIDPVAVADCFQRLGSQTDCRDFMQGAVFLAAAARGADVIVNIGVGHFLLRSCDQAGCGPEGTMSSGAAQFSSD